MLVRSGLTQKNMSSQKKKTISQSNKNTLSKYIRQLTCDDPGNCKKNQQTRNSLSCIKLYTVVSGNPQYLNPSSKHPSFYYNSQLIPTPEEEKEGSLHSSYANAKKPTATATGAPTQGARKTHQEN